MNKAALKERMLQLEEAELGNARDQYAEFVAEARLDPNEPLESDEISRASFAGDMAAAFADQPVQEHIEKRAILQSLDFGPRETVGEGAVIRLGDRWFVIAVATARFDFEGTTYMGISPAAPIYEQLDGLRAGETIRFGGRELELAEVH